MLEASFFAAVREHRDQLVRLRKQVETRRFTMSDNSPVATRADVEVVVGQIQAAIDQLALVLSDGPKAGNA